MSQRPDGTDRVHLDFTEIEAKRRAEFPEALDIRYSGFMISSPSPSTEPEPECHQVEKIKRRKEVHPAVALGLIGVVLIPLLLALLGNKSTSALPENSIPDRS